MSKKHPIVVVTGSSGAGTSTVKRAFEHIFERENINPVVIEGDSFHRYNRAEMKIKMDEAVKSGKDFSHFGADANEFDTLANLFKTYSETGTGKKRYYLHSEPEAEEHNARLGVDKKPVNSLPGRIFQPTQT
jgi:phosphoribulokinase